MTGKLKREIKQRRPFSSVQEEVVLALIRTADLVALPIAEVLRDAKLSLSQYNVLRILRGASGKPLSALEITERLIEETPGVSRLLDRLVAKGLVRRERSVQDRRMLECFISEQGLGVLARLDEVVDRADADAVRRLGRREVAVLNELLSRIRHATAG